jgi:hypothetical protein
MSDRVLHDDESEAAAARLARITEADSIFPIPDTGCAIGGDLETGIAFIEARRAYTEGLWLCTIFAAVAAIERHIAADLYVPGDDWVFKADFPTLLEQAERNGRINAFERVKYKEIAKLRDDYARFHRPTEMLDRLVEAGERGLGINEILQDDARMALTLCASYFLLNCGL